MNKLNTNIASIPPVVSLHRNTNQNFVPLTTVVAKLDPGATKHFLTEQDGNKLKKSKQLTSAQNAILPNNTIVKSTKVSILPLNKSLNEKACEALFFPNITNASLISVG